MYTKKQTVEIIDKLIELTQHGIITWEKNAPEQYMIDHYRRVELVFTAKHIGQLFRVYNRYFQHYYDEDTYMWDNEIIFEFIDENGVSLGILPNTPNTNDLFQSIQFQTSKVNNFYNDLFK